MMAFFFTMPIRSMIPISAKTSRSFWNRISASSAPPPADGSVERIVMGWIKLSYSTPRTRYTVTQAARIRINSLDSDDSNARAVPWKLGSMLAGMPRSCVTCLIWSTAAPSDAPGARLNESVTTGNWLWWVIVRGDEISDALIGDGGGAGAGAAAPVRALFVPASAMVVARLADADPIGTYMLPRAAVSC